MAPVAPPHQCPPAPAVTASTAKGSELSQPVAENDTTPCLFNRLRGLDESVQAQVAEEHNFRSANAALFPPSNDTTNLLLAACEQLASEKDTMAKAHFEEHTSELSYLCQRFNTSIRHGLTDAGAEAHKTLASGSRSSGDRATPSRRGRMFACCQREFPPRQSWWTDIAERLRPAYQVVRNGRLITVNAKDLQLGDVVLLSAGQRCAADGRILVYEEGTKLDASHLSLDAIDVRVCCTEATSAASIDSSNIVLKDSFLISGSLFCMVVRDPTHALIPNSMKEVDGLEDEIFLSDPTVPPGMSVSQCRTLFRQMAVRARVACRSFHVLVQLAQIRSLVIITTQAMIDQGSLHGLVATCKSLGQAVFLIGADCNQDALEAFAMAVSLEYVDLRENGCASSGQADVDVSSACASTALPSGLQSVTCQSNSGAGPPSVPQSVADGSCHSKAISGLSSPVASVSGLMFLQRAEGGLPVDARTRVSRLVCDVVAGACRGAVLQRPSQDAVHLLCQLLSDESLRPLFATGTFHYAAAFRTLVIGAKYPHLRATSLVDTSKNGHPMQSFHCGTPNQLQRFSTRSMSESHPTRSLGSKSRSVSTTQLSVDPVSLPKGDLACGPRPRVELAVSLNSVGVISDFSDCILLTPDMGCLAQAVELAHNQVPGTVVRAARQPGLPQEPLSGQPPRPTTSDPRVSAASAEVVSSAAPPSSSTHRL